MDILRFITAGSVDDGKSTLIGRMLYDTNNIKDDILESISATADDVNLAYLTDGLRSERQQGITIDVAYKYFTTAKRKYIITDAPGHFQYTKNLVTGASSADVIIILIDAVNGITSQTKRHLLVASFLKMKHIVVAINKMDLMAYDESVFTAIKTKFLALSNNLQLAGVTFIPMSALSGDNVTFHSTEMNWYQGGSLLKYLEDCESTILAHSNPMRLPIQYVDDCYYLGKLVAGQIKAGDRVVAHPQGYELTIEKIISGYETVEEVHAGQNIQITFTGNLKLERGNVLSPLQNKPSMSNELVIDMCWLDVQNPLLLNANYILRINTATTTCKVTEILHKIDNESFGKYQDNKQVNVNEFATVKVTTTNNMVFDSYKTLAATGRGILMDSITSNTVAAFTIQ